MPGIGEFLDSRLITSLQMPFNTQHSLIQKPFNGLLEYCHTADRYTSTPGDAKNWLSVQYKSIETSLWCDVN